MKLEEWSGNKITIRPSAVDGFLTCPLQWYQQHILGKSSVPGARAAIGTAIHAGIEEEWRKAIASGKKDFNLSAMQDRAVFELQELDNADSLAYDPGENIATAEVEAAAGVATYLEDIVPFTDIPTAVECRFSIQLANPIAERLSGTVDYLAPGVIADTKTSKRKPIPESYVTQQSLYTLLAEENGHKVEHNLIHGVVLKGKPEGHILTLHPNVPRAKAAVNVMLQTLDVLSQDIVPAELLFRGNPKHYLCDKRYCSHYNTCPYVKGDEPKPTKVLL